MNDKVKRFEVNYIPGHPPPIVTDENGSLCLFGELEVERLSHEKTKTQLEALEDLLYIEEIIQTGNHDPDNLKEGFESKYYDELDNDESDRLTKLRQGAIANSRARKNT